MTTANFIIHNVILFQIFDYSVTTRRVVLMSEIIGKCCAVSRTLNVSKVRIQAGGPHLLGKQGLSQSVHTSKRQLKEFLLNYIAQNNKNPRPFVWTKGPEKLQRIIEATKEYQAAHPRKLRKRRRKKSAGSYENYKSHATN